MQNGWYLMEAERYRLHKATMAVHECEREKIAVLIPEAAVLVVRGKRDEGRIAEVEWGERTLFLYMQELLENGAPLQLQEEGTQESG